MKPLRSLSEEKMKVKIPKHWTPEQADAVVEFLGDIEIAIRKKYQTRILNHQLYELNRVERLQVKKKKWREDDF
jgi:hypothetical protein